MRRHEDRKAAFTRRLRRPRMIESSPRTARGHRSVMMHRWKLFLISGVLGAASLNALACYTVYDHASRVIYNGEAPPVDMSLPLHDALAARFPAGAQLVFDTQASCPSFAPAPIARVARNGTPLLTNTRTAQAMGARYTQLAGGIAMVQPGAVNARPGISVVPAEAVAANVPREETVITEMREPPVSITQKGDRVVVGELSRY
jgi:hypothetical protein